MDPFIDFDDLIDGEGIHRHRHTDPLPAAACALLHTGASFAHDGRRRLRDRVCKGLRARSERLDYVRPGEPMVGEQQLTGRGPMTILRSHGQSMA